MPPTSPIARAVATIAFGALVGAGCTSEVAAPPATDGTISGEPSTIVTTPTIDTSTTTPTPATEPPTTDTATTEPPSTDTPTSTVEPPSGRPTSTTTEYFAGGDPDGWLYLGRWTGGTWENPVDDGAAPETSTSGGSDVTVLELDVDPIDGSTGADETACPDGRDGPSIAPNARAPDVPGFGYRSIAFETGWDPRPRDVAVVDADVPAYAEAGRAAFEGTGVDPQEGRIDQIVVADLDGDGDSESLVAFGGRGFSTLLLIDADTGTALTVARDAEEAPTPDASGTPVTAPATSYRTLDVADLNGDGLMEIVVHSWVAGVATVTVDTYDGTEVAPVLSNGC